MNVFRNDPLSPNEKMALIKNRKYAGDTPSEDDVRDAIVQASVLVGWRLWYIDAGAVRRVTRGEVGNNHGLPPPGWPDLTGLTPWGQFVGIEVKRPGNSPSDKQREHLGRIREFGGLAAWFDCAKAAYAWMRECNETHRIQMESKKVKPASS